MNIVSGLSCKLSEKYSNHDRSKKKKPNVKKYGWIKWQEIETVFFFYKELTITMCVIYIPCKIVILIVYVELQN